MLKKYHKNISINKEDIIKIKQYKICFKAKAISNINKKPSNKKYRYLEKVIIDIQGPIKVPTYNKYIYFIIFLNKGIQYLKISLLRNKSKAPPRFLDYEERVEKNATKIYKKQVHLDNAQEFIYSIKEEILKIVNKLFSI